MKFKSHNYEQSPIIGEMSICRQVT